MNQSETIFTALAFGVGIGCGMGCARFYGIYGFIFGFLAGGAAVMILLGLIRLVMPKGTRLHKRNKQ